MRWPSRKFPLGLAKHSHVVLEGWGKLKLLSKILSLWLNHLVLSTCNRCCSSRWRWHRRCGGSTISGDVHPRTLTLKTKLFQISRQSSATSWRSVVSRGHLGSLAVERIFLAKDQDHRLSLSPKIKVFIRKTTKTTNEYTFWKRKWDGHEIWPRLTFCSLLRVTCLTPP